jgi:hypothetical protein
MEDGEEKWVPMEGCMIEAEIWELGAGGGEGMEYEGWR